MKSVINIFFNELTQIHGELLLLSNSLSKYSTQQKENYEKLNLNLEYAHLSRLVISDIIGETDNGWFKRFALKPKFEVKIEELVEKYENLIVKQSGFAIVQCFESLNRFMRSSIINYFEKNPDIGKNILSIDNEETNINWVKAYNNYSNQKKNIELHTLTRISDIFKLGVDSNNYELKLGDYLSVLTLVRNRIIHNNFILTKDDYNNIGSKTNGINILKYFFPYNKNHNEFHLQIGLEKVKKNIDIIAEIGFLIFKSFSELLDYDWTDYIK